MSTDIYDAMTLELERAEVLTKHLATQLSDLGDRYDECYALSLIAEAIREKHALVLAKARALPEYQPATKGGA